MCYFLRCFSRKFNTFDINPEQPPASSSPTRAFDGMRSPEFDDFLDGMDARYLYWDEIKYRKDPPFGNDAQAAWALVKANRRRHYKTVALGRYVFNYYLTSQLQKELHEFDLKLLGRLHLSRATEGDDKEYPERSLIEEAIASSQIEGAATTPRVARDMLKSKRKPRNESERMIFNDLRAIRFITDSVHAPIDKAMVVELHRIMTADTPAGDCAGDYRKDKIYVSDHADGEIAHIPPDWDEVEQLMEALYAFADKEKEFIHPIAKASMIHFFIGFIHPFKDGNGRTARALFYWYLLKKEYALVKNISISRVILESRVQYDKAFLKTEMTKTT